MFVNRIAELRLLEQRYASDQAELFVLYGRRRVGKTELLARFCADKRHIFYVADLAAESTLRAGLSAAVGAVQFGSDAPAPVYSSWEDLFTALARLAQTERLVVVLDEFPYLVAAHPPLASTLQRLWDHILILQPYFCLIRALSLSKRRFLPCKDRPSTNSGLDSGKVRL